MIHLDAKIAFASLLLLVWVSVGWAAALFIAGKDSKVYFAFSVALYGCMLFALGAISGYMVCEILLS